MQVFHFYLTYDYEVKYAQTHGQVCIRTHTTMSSVSRKRHFECATPKSVPSCVCMFSLKFAFVSEQKNERRRSRSTFAKREKQKHREKGETASITRVYFMRAANVIL